MTARARLRPAALLALAGLTAIGAGGLAAPAPAAAACITTLPVSVGFTSGFAAAYGGVVPVRITTSGPTIRKLTVSLYTFGGDLIASGRARGAIASSQVVPLRMRIGTMQAGRYTLVLYGEPNDDPSCGVKHSYRVVGFRTCFTRLPVTFPQPPSGQASDYGDRLTVQVASRGRVLRKVAVDLSAADGTHIGTVRLDPLFGVAQADFPVPGGLQPGSYRVSVRGAIEVQPRSCGLKSTTTTLRFT